MGRVPKIQGFKELIFAFQVRNGFGAIVGILFLGGCASTYATRQVTYTPVTLAQPKSEIVESELLGVRVKPFAPGEIPEKAKESQGLSKEIRKAEGYYSAVQLRNAMQESGYWGPVRVVPGEVTGGELIITGRILESDGEILKLEVRVHDATGVLWSESEYEEVVDIKHYEEPGNGGEVFKFLYQRIANDVARLRDKLPRKDVDSIRQVAELRFAEDFAPEAFGRYLERGGSSRKDNVFLNLMQTTKSETVKVARLPANDDPTLTSIRRIRVSEEGFIDTLDLQHENLSRKIGDPYTQWRIARLKEMNAVRKLETKRNEKMGQAVAIGVGGLVLGIAVAAVGGRGCYACASAGGSVAGAAATAAVQLAVQASKQAEEEAEIHKAALAELGESLSRDLQVTIVQVEGETFQLKGTTEAQFKQWRAILKEIHEREVGAPVKE